MIAKFFYENPRILLLMICVIIGAGVSSLWVMPRLEDPVLGKRVGVITTAFPGADAQRVESLVTLRFEKRLLGLSDIKRIRSNSRAGISNLVIELQDQVNDAEPVWAAVRTEMEKAADQLPDGCLTPDLDVFPLKAFAALVALKPPATGGSFAVLRGLAHELQTKLTNMAGVESVEVFGDSGEEFLVDLRPEALRALDLSVAAIARQVAEDHVTQPAGVVRSGSSQLLVDVDSPIDSVDALRTVMIRYGVGPDAKTVALGEIAEVAKTVRQPQTNIALIDGEQSIVLGAYVDDSMRIDHWARRLDGTLAEFAGDYPADLQLDLIFSQSTYIRSRMDMLVRNLIIGAVGVTLVVLLLMGWKSMVVVGITLPLSALMVLTGMRWMNIPIHQMAVTGLIVALGLLIDNAIVIVEEVRARMYAGASAHSAITSGVRHLAMPLFGSTLTTTLAFLPIATLPGPPGEFVGSIAISVILAITSSFVLAMTIVPALQAFATSGVDRRGILNYGLTLRPLKWVYERSLDFVFRFPLLGVLASVALPALGFMVAPTLPEQFFPPSDRNQIQIEVELPASQTIDRTLATVRAMQDAVSASPDIERAHWFIGASAPTFYYNVVPRRRGAPFYAQATAELSPGSSSLDAVRKLQDQLNQEFTQCRTVVRQLEQGPPVDAPIEIRVSGPDLDVLHDLGSRLRLVLSRTSNVVHTRSDFEETIPKLALDADAYLLSQMGIRSVEVAQQLYTTLEGASGGAILVGEEELPVRVRLASASSRLDQVASLPLHSLRPAPVMMAPTAPNGSAAAAARRPSLDAVANIRLDADRASIVRVDGVRTNEVKAYLRAGVLPSEVLAEFQRRLDESDFQLRDGYSMSFGGENAERTTAVRNLIANAVVLFLLIVMTLVVSFRSFRDAGVIAMVGGLAMGLGPLALWWFGFPFGFMAIVGTMGLVGVAINDSIVVLAAIKEDPLAASGDPQQLKAVVVGATRHIVATTLTTIVGFAPLVFGGGGFWPPLAITIAGGVGGATFLALYFVPAMTRLLPTP